MKLLTKTSPALEVTVEDGPHGKCGAVTCPELLWEDDGEDDGCADSTESAEWNGYEQGDHEGHVDALYSMVLAHACAGIDVTTEVYATGVQAVLDGMLNS